MALRDSILRQTHAKKDSRLPSEYQEVEWIQKNTANISINTGWQVSPSIEWEIRFCSTRLGVSQYIGAGESDKNVRFWAGHNSGNDFIIGFNTARSPSSYTNPAEFNTVRLMNGRGFIVNGVTTELSESVDTNDSIFLFRFAYNTFDFIGKISYSKIWQNGELKQHLVACYRKSDGKVGMYDLVTNAFFTNSGSGSFIAGPNV